jgi:Tol biopolymer transport system component
MCLTMRFNFPPKIGVGLPLLGVLALLGGCGGGSSSEPEVAIPYQEKVTLLEVLDNQIIFTVQVDSGRFELFSADPISSVRTGISDEFSALNGLRPMAVSPDGNRIGYRADRDHNGTDELYSNLLDGSDEVLLASALPVGTVTNSVTQAHYNWQWLADSSGVVFRSDPDSNGVFQIQKVDADGSNSITLSANLPVRCVIAECWKMDGVASQITFLVESTNSANQIAQALYAVTPNGSGLVMLNPPLSVDSRILDWQWAPNALSLAFISQNAGQAAELWVVNSDATLQTLISDSGITNGVSQFAWSPDSSRLAFAEDAITANNASLYINVPDASDRIHLIDTFRVANPQLVDWQWAPDSNRIGYRADQETAGLVELFTVESDGQWHRRMNPPMLASDSLYGDWRWSPNGGHIAFLGEIESAQLLDELYSAAADGSQTRRVNLALTTTAQVLRDKLLWTQNGSRLIYPVTNSQGVIEGLYSVQADGSDNRRLNDSLAADQWLLGDFRLSSDGARVIYQQSGVSGEVSLHVADLTAGNRFNLSTVGVVSQPAWHRDDSRIIYVFRPTPDASEQLLSIHPDGTGKTRLY